MGRLARPRRIGSPEPRIDRNRRVRCISRRLLLSAAICGSALLAGRVAPASAARTAAETCQGPRSHPIVFVHGLEKEGLGGADADAYWLDMVTELRSLGWCSDLVRV